MTSSGDTSDQQPMARHTLERKKRKDAGKARWQDRDYYVLKWIGQQGVIRYDQLRMLLGRESTSKNDYSAILSPSATNNATNRWETEHFVHSGHVVPGQQTYY